MDTHVLIRWLVDPGRLSPHQSQVLRDSVLAREPLSISAMSLIDIAVLKNTDGTRMKKTADELFSALNANSALNVLPITLEVAAELASLGNVLRDRADRTIVATARVHRLTLLTSDQRIIESGLVPVIE